MSPVMKASITTDDSEGGRDNVFEDLNPNSGKSPKSKSLAEIINIVKNSHQENPLTKRILTLELKL